MTGASNKTEMKNATPKEATAFPRKIVITNRLFR